MCPYHVLRPAPQVSREQYYEDLGKEAMEKIEIAAAAQRAAEGQVDPPVLDKVDVLIVEAESVAPA